MFHVITDDPFEIVSSHDSLIAATRRASVNAGQRAQSTAQVFEAQRRTLEACYS